MPLVINYDPLEVYGGVFIYRDSAPFFCFFFFFICLHTSDSCGRRHYVFTPIPFLCMKYRQNTLKKFIQIWQELPVELKEELITFRSCRSKIKVIVILSLILMHVISQTSWGTSSNLA